MKLKEKTCNKCNERKPKSDFHKDTTKDDGLRTVCKRCTLKQQKKYVKKNKDKVYSGNKKYASKNRGKINSYNTKYKKTDKGAENARKSVKAYSDRYPEKRKARNDLNHAVIAGDIARGLICELCGDDSGIIHGHHWDYSKPLNVVWCCVDCHSGIHNNKLIENNHVNVEDLNNG